MDRELYESVLIFYFQLNEELVKMLPSILSWKLSEEFRVLKNELYTELDGEISNEMATLLIEL